MGFHLTRVAATDGKSLTSEQWAEIDLQAFERTCGRTVLPSEIGCYLSHLTALQLIADGDDEMAVVVEDDLAFTGDLSGVLGELAGIAGWDIVKLVNHRISGFIKRTPLDANFALGRCLHGPLGSTAAYVVRRGAAKRLVKSLRPMVVPIDVELERGWYHRTAVFTVNKPVVQLTRAVSTISGQGGYRSTKFPFYRRAGALIYRTGEYLRRVAYAVVPSKLRREGAPLLKRTAQSRYSEMGSRIAGE